MDLPVVIRSPNACPKCGVLGGTRSYPTDFCLFVQFNLWSNSEFRLGPGQLLLQSLVSLCLGQAS